ncbi:hypothetical protein CALCODRAFT_508788 [Calocera cornea HHB12733]|uniref:Uncharacterized protein n=1 Tax=Calocera cornea HHB12733 TaxID=1353952 RepID=A0A165G1E6_9BASI|nr:hypothetical protein CALCODRAFT_508788 [Calocera cornea HHB12733]
MSTNNLRSDPPSSVIRLGKKTRADRFELLILLSKDNSRWKKYIKSNRGWARSFLVEYVDEDGDRFAKFTKNMKKIMRSEWLTSKEDELQRKEKDVAGPTKTQLNRDTMQSGEKTANPRIAARKTIVVTPENTDLNTRPTRPKISLYTHTPLPSEGYRLRGKQGEAMKKQVQRVRKIAGLQYDDSTTHYIWKQLGVKLSYDEYAAAQTAVPSADFTGLKEGESADKFNETWVT